MLLGDATYEGEFEADEEEDHGTGGEVDANRHDDKEDVKYTSTDVDTVLSDDWTVIPSAICKGAEVAVIKPGGHYTKIRYGGVSGWTLSANLQDTASIDPRFIVSPAAPATIFDINLQQLNVQLTHGLAFSLVKEEDGWSQIRAPGISTAVWVDSKLIAAVAPQQGGADTQKGGKRGKGKSKGKDKGGASKGKDNTTITLDDLKSETWPKFASHGPKVTVAQLSASAASKLASVKTKSSPGVQRAVTTSSAEFSKSLDSILPARLPTTDTRWETIKDILRHLAIKPESIGKRADSVDAVKLLLTRLKTLKGLDPSA